MAKDTKNEKKVAAPNFKDVPKAVVEAAATAVRSGGSFRTLTVPKNAVVSQAKDGSSYARWSEEAVIQSAYRTATAKGLMDVTVEMKIRQSESNNGGKVYSHFYMNMGEDVSEAHEAMNERSLGAIATLLTATGLMPAGGALKGTLLDKMFPPKNQPGSHSPLAEKVVIVNIVQTNKQKRDKNTNKPMFDDEGNAIMEKRDQGETFLPVGGNDEDDEEE